MKIYTKTGDKGLTGLFGGARIPKDDARIEAYGTVDELNSLIGVLAEHVDHPQTVEHLRTIQNRLFDLGSVLATDPNSDFKLPGIEVADIFFLEQQMDLMDEKLPALKNFIIPGGSPAVSYAHVCRTVCRRAERRVISLAQLAEIDQNMIIYLNRLSDYFFILARYLGLEADVPEVIWKARL